MTELNNFLVRGAARIYRLEKTGHEDSALLLVLVAKVLAVADLLLPGPAPHLKTTDKSEEQDAPAQLAN